MARLDGLNKMKKYAWDPKSVNEIIIIKVKAPPRLELGLEDLESFVLPLHHRAPSDYQVTPHFINLTLRDHFIYK